MLNCINCSSYDTIKHFNSVPKINIINSRSHFSSNLTPRCYAKGDSAASQHYWRERDVDVLETIHEEPGAPVTLPNSSKISYENRILPRISHSSQVSTVRSFYLFIFSF